MCVTSDEKSLIYSSTEYIYSGQLRALEQGVSVGPLTLPPEACKICTPLKPEAWQVLLKDHPDSWFSNFILRGIEKGFRIGFHGDQENLRA